MRGQVGGRGEERDGMGWDGMGWVQIDSEIGGELPPTATTGNNFLILLPPSIPPPPAAIWRQWITGKGGGGGEETFQRRKEEKTPTQTWIPHTPFLFALCTEIHPMATQVCYVVALKKTISFLPLRHIRKWWLPYETMSILWGTSCS